MIRTRFPNNELPLPVVLRPDLRFGPIRVGDSHQVVKDPVSLRYFSLQIEEAAILKMLNGTVTITDVRHEYARRFAPRTASQHQILTLLRQAQHDGLLLTRRPGVSRDLLKRHDVESRNRWLTKLINPFVFRWHGFNPNTLLQVVYPLVRWMFWPQFLGLCLLTCVSALILIVVQFHEFQTRWPEFQTFFAMHNVVLLIGTVAIIKVGHELAHALTCKHFGGECHELGVMFVLFTPLLYCNVTDAWMFRERWHRVAVSAAGMIVELTIAAMATFVWFWTEAGPVNSVSRTIMIVCSVGTVFVNGNPLLKFDGYFILSDVWGIPNLWSRSRGLVYDVISRTLLGTSPYNVRSLPTERKPLLVGYALASMIYRTTVIVALLWLVKEFCAIAKLQSIFPLFVALTVAGFVTPPLLAMVRLMRNPVARSRIHRGRFSLAAIAVAALLVVACLVPVPKRIRTMATIQARNADTVYVTVPGILTQTVSAGQRVHQGQLLARLRNDELQLSIAQATSELRSQEARVRALTASQTRDDEARRLLPSAHSDLEHLRQRLDELHDKLARLDVSASRSGVVLPSYKQPEPTQDACRLRCWSGTPLNTANTGCFLDTGTVYCSIGEPESVEATLTLKDRDMQRIHVGDRVSIRIPGYSAILRGVISDVSRFGSTVIAGRDHSVVKRQLDRPAQTLYQARIALDLAEKEFPMLGSTGNASVTVKHEAIASTLVRSIRMILRPS